MTVPAGGEIALYTPSAVDGIRKSKLEWRVIVGFLPQWTGPVEDTFAAAISSKLWASTYHGGATEVAGGRALFKSYGGAPYETLLAGANWFPSDPALAFAAEWVAKFHEADPVYSPLVTAGGWEQTNGVEADPMRVVQGGSAYVAGASIGKIYQHSAETIDNVGIANDVADHTYRMEWDPDAPGGAGSEKLTIRFDGTIVAETSTAGSAVAARYILAGLIHPVRTKLGVIVPGAGTVASPVTLMSLDRVKVEENGDGYETATYPAWTFANAGGGVTGGDWATLDAVPGELFEEDGIFWAIIPHQFIAGMPWGGPTRRGVRKLNLDLAGLGSDGTTLFVNERWGKRPVFIDTQIVNDAEDDESPWRRLGSFLVDEFSANSDGVRVVGTDRPMSRLDVADDRVYIGLEADGNAIGEADYVNLDFNVQEILEDHVNAADALQVHPLNVTDRVIFAPDIIPIVYDTGGASLGSSYLGLCDRLAQEVCTFTTMTGTGKYGALRSNLWTFGTGTPVWTFYGRGGAEPADIEAPGPTLDLSARGPDLVVYHQNNPLQVDQLLTLQQLPLVGTFPAGGGGRVLSDSIAVIDTTALSVITAFPDANGDPQYGGVAKFRWLLENLARRQVTFQLVNHDWLDVGMEIAIDDPDGRGITTDETWVVDSIDYAITSKNELLATVTCLTTSIVRAMAA